MNRRRRAVSLVELLAVFLLAGPLLLVLGRVVVDALYVQRLAAQHADQVAVMDSLSRRLRQDALACAAWNWDADRLTLVMEAEAGPAEVVYTLEPGRIARRRPDGQQHEWRSRRLGFAWRLDSGPGGALLVIEFVQERPPRASRVLPRTFAVSLLLPPGGPAAAQAGGE